MSETKRYWRSLDELANTPDFQKALTREFPEDLVQSEPDGTTRRHFLTVAGASVAMSSLAGCVRRPEHHILPYSKQPEDLVPGIAQHYATATSINGRAVGLLVEAHEGRPTKIEGNPDHPQSFGGTSAIHQALVLGLYDPMRLRIPMNAGKATDWTTAVEAFKKHFEGLKANGGSGLMVLAESLPSPTLNSLREKFQGAYPQAKWLTYESLGDDNQRTGLKAAYGEAVVPVHRLQGVKVAVSLDCDFLGHEGDVVVNARHWAQSRRLLNKGDVPSRLYSIEGAYSITGTNADHRLRLKPSQLESFLWSLAAELTQEVAVVLPEDMVPHAKAATGVDAKFVKAVAKDLLAHRGGQSAILVGRRVGPAAHALALALNHALGNNGGSVHYFVDRRRPATEAGDFANIKAATEALASGQVDTLLVLGGNPAYTAPGDLGFAAAMGKAKTTICLCDYLDETSTKATWALPRAHFLETWGDVYGTDGTVAIQQPVIAPLWGGKSEIELIALATGEPQSSGHDLVRGYWKQREGAVGFYKKWRGWLNDGLRKDPEFGVVPSFTQPAGLGGIIPSVGGGETMEIVFTDGFLHDGRFANNSWLLELPDPISKVCWDNPLQVGVKLAEKLGLADEDRVSLEVGGNKIEAAVVVVPGMADDTVSIALGYGRHFGNFLPYHEAGVVGFDASPLRTAASPYFGTGLKLTKLGTTYALAKTQVYSRQDPGFGFPARALVREATVEEYKKNPTFAKPGIIVHGKPRPAALVVHPPERPIHEERAYEGTYQWGMVIDLNTCTGCGSCMVARVSENNISMVGKDQVRRGRDMHWIRMDRYFVGDEKRPDDVDVVHQPMPCQQCENAPCENVCPVAATVHSPEGLNDMAYNRCIGTRYCSNNCPFKVRRFNFYNYSKGQEETVQMQRNPNVTVRFRGVMEKCTYCVQRINIGKRVAKLAADAAIGNAKVEATKTAIDAIVPACQQACPAGAIVFGNIADATTEVSKLRRSDRDYRLLSELNVKPRTSYLGKVRNTNPELGT